MSGQVGPPRKGPQHRALGVGESIQGMLQWAVQNQEAVHAARRAYVAPQAIAAK